MKRAVSTVLGLVALLDSGGGALAAPDAGPPGILQEAQEAELEVSQGEPDRPQATPAETPLDPSRVGGTALASGLLIMLLISAFRSQRVGAPVLKLTPRQRILLPAALSAVAGLVADHWGVPGAEAALVALFAGPTAVFAHESLSESLLNRRLTRASTAREEG